MSRQMAAIALAALLLGGAGVAAAVSHHDGGDGKARDSAPPVTTSIPLLLGTTTTTLAPARPSATAGVPSTTPGPATTTGARPTTTTRPAISTTFTTTGECTASQIQVMATTDRTVYGAGQQVKVDSTLRNRSQTTCSYAGHTFQVTIQTPSVARSLPSRSSVRGRSGRRSCPAPPSPAGCRGTSAAARPSPARSPRLVRTRRR